MTYSSRNFLISWGVGRDERVPRFSKRLSTAMMSLQTSTHSSQMKTVGPAMSFRTSFWSLLQKEQRRTSGSPAFLTMCFRASPRDVCPGRQAVRPAATRDYLGPLANNIINNTVFLALVGRHDVIALRIILDTLDRLASMVHQDVVQPLAHSQDLAGCNINIGRLARKARHQRLMDDNP